MAIQVNTGQQNLDGNEVVEIKVDNGDKLALEQIKRKWKFKNEESLMRFAMAVLLKAEDNRLWVKTNGQAQSISPADELLNTSPPNAATESEQQ